MNQDERDARLGFRALAAMGSIPPPPGPRYPGVTVRLVGEDGNVFAIIGRIQRALVKAERDGEVPAGSAATWAADAFQCRSYDAVLRLAMDRVSVE